MTTSQFFRKLFKNNGRSYRIAGTPPSMAELYLQSLGVLIHDYEWCKNMDTMNAFKVSDYWELMTYIDDNNQTKHACYLQFHELYDYILFDEQWNVIASSGILQNLR